MKRKIAPCVGSLEAYKKASSASKHNTVLGCKDDSFLKEIYSIEENDEWRKLCIKNIRDKDFLENVAKKDSSPRVRKQAAMCCDRESLIAWLKDNDPSEEIRKYAKSRFSRLPNSMKFMVE